MYPLEKIAVKWHVSQFLSPSLPLSLSPSYLFNHSLDGDFRLFSTAACGSYTVISYKPLRLLREESRCWVLHLCRASCRLLRSKVLVYFLFVALDDDTFCIYVTIAYLERINHRHSQHPGVWSGVFYVFYFLLSYFIAPSQIPPTSPSVPCLTALASLIWYSLAFTTLKTIPHSYLTSLYFTNFPSPYLPQSSPHFSIAGFTSLHPSRTTFLSFPFL